jgi:hypothetical protein
MQKTFLTFVIYFFIVACVQAQTQKFTPAEKELIGVIDKFFEYFHKGDSSQLRPMFHTKARLQSLKYKNGKAELSDDSVNGLLEAVAKLPKDVKIQEKILDYKIQIDADLAIVWTPYKFYINDKLSHCGANAFMLVKTGENWQIIQLTDTRRKENCE